MGGNVCFVPLEGGELIDVNVPNPAPGADWVYTIPAGYEMTLLHTFYRLVTDANLPTRYPMFNLWGVDNFDRVRMKFGTFIGPGAQNNFSLALGSARADAYTRNTYHDALPMMRCLTGERWGSATSNLQAGDQYSLIHFLAVRWRV